MNEYSGAKFILLSQNDVILDTSRIAQPRKEKAAFLSGLGLVDKEEATFLQEQNSLGIAYSSVALYTGEEGKTCKATLNSVLSLEATCSSSSEFSAELSTVIASSSFTCVSELESTVTLENVQPLLYTGQLYSVARLDNLNIFFTSTGVFLQHRKRNFLLGKNLLASTSGCVYGTALLLGTENGIFSTTIADTLQGLAPSLLLSETTTPALTSNMVLRLSADQQALGVFYATSLDYFSSGLSLAPVSVSGVTGGGEILAGQLAYLEGGIPKISTLPDTNQAVSGLAVTKSVITHQQRSNGTKIAANLFFTDRYGKFYYEHNGSIIEIAQINNVSGALPGSDVEIHRFGVLGDIFWLMNYRVGYYTTYEDTPPHVQGGLYFQTFRMTGSESTFTLTTLDTLHLCPHHVIPSGAGWDEQDAYDYLVFPVTGPVEYVSGVPYFFATLRKSFEKKIIDMGGASAKLAEASALHKLSFDPVTGAITDVEKTITNVHSGWPCLRFQHGHQLENTPFALRHEGGLWYTGRTNELFTNFTSGDEPYVSRKRRIYSFPEATYDEGTSSYPQPSRILFPFEDVLEAQDLIKIDDTRVCLLASDRDSSYYLLLLGLNKADRASTPLLSLIGEPVLVIRDTESSSNALEGTYFDNNVSCPASGQVVALRLSTEKEKDLVYEITDRGLVPSWTSAIHDQGWSSDLSLNELSVSRSVTGLADPQGLYTVEQESIKNATKVVKGKSFFFLADSEALVVYKERQAQVVFKQCLDLFVSPDAMVNTGHALSVTENFLLAKPLCGEINSLYQEQFEE